MFEVSTVKAQRLRLGLTQHALAKLAGVSQSLLAKLEAGRIDPSYSSVRKIEQALSHAHAKEEPKASEVMIKRIISASPKDSARDIALILRKHNISQIPVIDKGQVLGLVTETGLLEKEKLDGLHALDVLSDAPPLVPEDTRRSLLVTLLRQYPCVLVQKDGKVTGIVAKSDLVRELL